MKNVIITGSSKGFGYLAAKDFAKKGYKVWATMRNSDTKNSIAKKELEDFSDFIRVEDMDVTDDVSVTTCIERIIDEDKKIDILINNAGIIRHGISEAISLEQAQHEMNTNYFGMIRATQAVVPSMREAERGLIINCSSQFGRLAMVFFANYCATKFAIEAYSQVLRYELAPFGVDIALVEPSGMATNAWNPYIPEERKDIVAQYPVIKQVHQKMSESFEPLLKSDEANPQLVADLYLKLAEADPGKRPIRSFVGMDWGTTKINELTQSIQDSLLTTFQVDSVFAHKY